MGSVNPPKKRDYGHKTRIDLNQSYQVAYWKERFGVSEQELSEAVHAAGALARKVEEYLKKDDSKTNAKIEGTKKDDGSIEITKIEPAEEKA